MSQAGIIGLSEAPLPPSVPQTFTTNFQSNGTSSPGIVTPVANNVFVGGFTGIITEAQQTLVANDTILVLFANGTATTTNVQTQTVLQLTTNTNSGFTCNILFSGYDSLNNLAFGARMCVLGKNIAGTASIITELENLSGGDAALNGCLFAVSTAGSLVNINVTGVAAHTIIWNVITPGIIGSGVPPL